LNRSGIIQNLKPLLNLVQSQKESITTPILNDLAGLLTGTSNADNTGFLRRRIDRIYSRLCRISGELDRLDFKNAPSGISPEDYVFSRIDFSRYRQINAQYFDRLFPEGLSDFSEDFFKKNFGYGRRIIKLIIEKGYVKKEGIYQILKENPLILSIMRTLEISLDSSPLFTIEEIEKELNSLGTNAGIPSPENVFPLLVLCLDNVLISHADGMKTKLFFTQGKGLEGTFHPGNKAWTRVLIPLNHNLPENSTGPTGC